MNGRRFYFFAVFQISRLQRELSDTKEEVRGVLSALEEVAGSIEQKNKELEDKQTEFEREAALNRDKQVCIRSRVTVRTIKWKLVGFVTENLKVKI